MAQYSISDIRFFCELVLLETSPSAQLKDAFWNKVRTDPTARYVNPRYRHGELFCTIRRTTTIPITCTIFIDHKTNAVVVCFPGTNDAKQVSAFLTLRSTQVPHQPNALLHAQKGFTAIFAEITEEVLAQLRSACEQFPDYNVVLAGYSLGGSLCRLLMWRLYDFPNKVNVITWGAPRVFNRTAALYYTEVLLKATPGRQDTRYEMPGDRIVHLPPEWTGYVHVGNRVLMTQPDLKEMNTRFERLFAGIHQSYIPNMRFTLQTLLKQDDDLPL